jgi:hypothetical protein
MIRCAGVLAALAVLLMAGRHAGAAEVPDTRPAQLAGKLPAVPNDAAILSRIRAPETGEGYGPQGLTLADDALLASSHRSAEPEVGSGPCRACRIDPASGRTTGQFDMPPACGHAGGLTCPGQGMLLVADTRELYRIDLARALGWQDDSVVATLGLGGEMKGSLAGFDGKAIFIASPEKDEDRARGFFLPLSPAAPCWLAATW